MKKYILVLVWILFLSLFSFVKADFICTMIYSPVVWTDWKTYGNECLAKVAWAFWEKVENEKILNSYLDFSLENKIFETNREKFLEKYWKICSTASDGVNILSIKDGKFFTSTRAWYPENFTPFYSCISFSWFSNDDIVKINFEKSLEKLTLLEIKEINDILKKFYSRENNYLKNIEKSIILLKKIDELRNNNLSEKNILILDYVKYQIIELITEK